MCWPEEPGTAGQLPYRDAVGPRRVFRPASAERVRLHGAVLDIGARNQTITVKYVDLPGETFIADLPEGWTLSSSPEGFIIPRVAK